MEDSFDDIVETFEFLDDWEDRYRHVIELGKAMEPLPDSLRVDAAKVEGCASQVWIVPQVDGVGPKAVLQFEGASDAMIVQGLIAILRSLLSGQTAQQILETDAIAEFARLGLDQHLSSQRSNGLRAMIERVRALASKAVDA